MKLRASFFNGTVFKKNLTRFAPAWVLCTLYVLIYIFLSTLSSTDRFAAEYAQGGIQSLATVNFFYAFLVAQLLFGDLYQSRLCSGVHAMPIRRECWFFTNTVSGLVFMLIPVGVLNILAACTTSGSIITGSEMIVPWVFLGHVLSYICFFGIAVLSALCVGKRFAAVLVYCLLNFGAFLVYGMVSVFYTMDYYGVAAPEEPFVLFSPLSQLLDCEFFAVNVVTGQDYYKILRGTVTLSDGWGYLWICGAVGIAALVLALLVYRKRHLERAGDFITVKKLEPVFLLVYTLTCGLFFSLFWEISGSKFFLYLGIAVGWFTCLMFLKRTTRVFKWKTILGCILLMAVLGGSFIVNDLDPFGIERRIPEKDDVKAVYVTTGGDYQITHYSNDAYDLIKMEDDEDIDAVLKLHALALRDKVGDDSGFFALDNYDSARPNVRYYIRYELEDGTTLQREYRSYTDTEAGDILRCFFTRTTCVLGITEDQVAGAKNLFANTFRVKNTDLLLSADQVQSLVEAIAADCAEGNMAQNADLHENDDSIGRIYLYPHSLDYGNMRVIVYESSTHTRKWLEENDMLQYMFTEDDVKYDYEYYYYD